VSDLILETIILLRDTWEHAREFIAILAMASGLAFASLAAIVQEAGLRR
jgi:hypothetical protein